ncbi:MAG: hypothetical protein KDJ80_13370 [Nitratireductor sp.]|nr:hypothetical protein [Nitratireductor sp.]
MNEPVDTEGLRSARTQSGSALNFFVTKALPVWLLVAVMGVIVVPGLADDALLREMMEALGIIMLMLSMVGRFWTLLSIEPGEGDSIPMQGPFRYTAHPMTFFFAMGMMGIGFMYESLILGVILFIICLVASKYWVEAGEPEAPGSRSAGSFDTDDDYRRYRSLVPGYIPSLRPGIAAHHGDRLSYSQATLALSAREMVVFAASIPIVEIVQWWQEAHQFVGFIVLP